MFQLFKTFVSVYETRNFTKSAEKLFISQPTISMQIKKLEAQLQIQLFIRSGKQEVIPTKEATFLYPRTLKILEEWADTESRLIQKDNFREKCAIGASHTCAVYFVPKIMPALMKKFPRVDFNLTVMNSEEVVIQLEQNKLDLGFIEKPARHQSLKQQAIYQDELVLAGKADADIWLLRETDSGLRLYNEQYLEKHNFNPHIMQVNNNEAILALIKNGVGTSIVSKLALTSKMPWQSLTEDAYRDFYLLTHQEVLRQILTEIETYLLAIVPKINFTNK